MHAQIMLIESIVSRIYCDIDGMMCVVLVARRRYLISCFELHIE